MKFLNLNKGFSILALATITTIFVSCSGEDGKTGADGIGIVSTVDNGDGTITINYSDGSSFTTGDLTGDTGADGEDGNANVQSIDLDLSQIEAGESPLVLEDISELNKGNMAGKAIFYYLIANDVEGDEVYVSLPGLDIVLGNRYEITLGSNDDNGFLIIYTFDIDGNVIPFPVAEEGSVWDTLRVVLVEIDTDSETGKSAADFTKDYFDKIGVNPSNYQEMADYFNLEE